MLGFGHVEEENLPVQRLAAVDRHRDDMPVRRDPDGIPEDGIEGDMGNNGISLRLPLSDLAGTLATIVVVTTAVGLWGARAITTRSPLESLRADFEPGS